ncbi:MAG: hypothetical protein RIG68_10390 [Imperialibacter sp.]|uniref:hypothetical protein n=1 Tax=Imperialibacter sp. TaxID=2038411 RepID=UPI0032EF3871
MLYLMVKKLSSRDLNKTVVLCLVLLLSGFLCQAQLVVEKNVPGPVVTAQSVDRRGDFYLAFKNGTVAKYDTTGRQIVNYSPRRLGQVTLIDPWNPLKTFLFYEEFQSIVILDRFMSPTIEYDLTGKSQSFIRLACPSQDNSFWLIDESYNGLIKFDPIDQKIQSKIPFNASIPVDGKILFIREYQNVLFASLDSGGIIYFDNLGNYQGVIDSPPCSFFCFSKNQLYLTSRGSVFIQDLYSNEKNEISLPDTYLNALLIGPRVVGTKKEGGFNLLR